MEFVLSGGNYGGELRQDTEVNVGETLIITDENGNKWHYRRDTEDTANFVKYEIT